MLTLPIEQARHNLQQLAEQVAAGGEPVTLELPDGRRVVLSGAGGGAWLEQWSGYEPPDSKTMQDALAKAASLRQEIETASAGTEAETIVEGLERIREERLGGLTGLR